MLRDFLHITIITYNRPDQLKNTLIALSETQLKHARVTVLDNNSDSDTYGIVNMFKGSFVDLDFEKRRVNVGYGGNVMRAYEVAKAKYQWVLGDDDVIHQEHIKPLVEAILSDNFDLIRISDVGTNGEKGSAIKLGDLLHDPNSLSFYSFGFISGIIHKKITKSSSFVKGYKYIYTEYPQLYVLFNEFDIESDVLTLKNNIITRGGTNHIGAEIIGYQFLSLDALPTKRAKKIAMSYRRKRQRLIAFLLSFGQLILVDKLRGASIQKLINDAFFSIKHADTLPAKVLLLLNSLVIFFPRSLLIKFVSSKSIKRGV